ncbi:MAG: methylmalonyl-CoA epimerase [Myxococcota bacterium]
MLKLDHVAIAVPDLDEAIRRWSEDLGLALAGTEDVESAQTSTAFFPVTDDQPARIELVAPLRGEGPIRAHLDKRGGGLHHLCFRTDDVRRDMETLKAKGYRFTTEAPYGGAHGSLVCFLHPKSTGGVLIELAQYAGSHHE